MYPTRAHVQCVPGTGYVTHSNVLCNSPRCPPCLSALVLDGRQLTWDWFEECDLNRPHDRHRQCPGPPARPSASATARLTFCPSLTAQAPAGVGIVTHETCRVLYAWNGAAALVSLAPAPAARAVVVAIACVVGNATAATSRNDGPWAKSL